MLSKYAVVATAFFALSTAPLAVQAADVDYDAQIAEYIGDADVEKLMKDGKKAYRKCKACHELAKDKNKVGPHQVGIFGRPAGVVEGFKYSDVLKESGWVWDVATMEKWISDKSSNVLKGTKMNFAGLKKEKDVKAVIYYMYKEGGVWDGAGTN